MSVRIFNENFLIDDLLANKLASSEQTAFPSINALNLERRSRVWRTGGYWLIDSSNNEIVFEETAATPLTATIAEAGYTSTTALLAAIKTALEAVGASTYTVELDTLTLRVKITSDGAGGGGILTIFWSLSSIASTIGFSATSTDSGALTYTADVLRIHTEEFFQFDFGIATLPKAFCLIGPRNSPIKITPSAVIKIEGNETSNWSSPTSSITVDYDDEVLFSVNPEGLWSEQLRYARVQFVDNANPQGFVEIGALFMGNFFEATRGAVQFPFQGNYVDRSRTVFSEGGQTFSDTREQTESFSVNWFGLTIAEKEEIDDVFASLGTSNPFFVQFDSDNTLAFSTRKEKYIRYVKFSEPPSYQLESPGNFSCRMTFLEEL